MQGWITEEIKKIKRQNCTVCLGWSKLDKALVFGDVGDRGEEIADMYIFTGLTCKSAGNFSGLYQFSLQPTMGHCPESNVTIGKAKRQGDLLLW